MDTSVMLQSPRPSRSILRGTSFSGVRLPGVARGPAQTRTGPRKAVNVTAILDVAKAAFAQQNGAKVDPKIQVEISSLPQEIRSKLTYDLGTKSASPEAAYRATALSVRQRLIDAFNKTQEYWRYSPPPACLTSAYGLAGMGNLCTGLEGIGGGRYNAGYSA